jgi:predicted dehydrogenase
MAQRVGYGIAGCGMMGQEHIRNLLLLPGARVAAVFDPVPDLAAQAAQLAGGADIVPDFAALLAHPRVDALVIVSPNDAHVPQLLQVAAARPRPVMVEKPLFTRPGDGALLDQAFAAWPAPVWVAMEYRYMPPIAALVAEAANATGGVRMLTIREHRFPFLPKVGHWNRFNARTGGTFVEKCCHFFDLMRLILNDEPVRIMASAGQAVNHRDESYDGRTPDIWDHGYVICDFAGGARAMLELCMFAEGARYQEEIVATGPLGRIEALVPGPGRFWPPSAGPAPTPRLIHSPRTPKGPRDREIPVDPALLAAGDHNGATFYQHQRFLAAIRDGTPVEVTLTDGVRAVEMGLAAQLAATEGRAITL